mmetsp:Transcript_41615/g.46985  ORF Transcript_41615/g.46985 Transcript_41615/m.46985 type:complete len:133 (-) Transcript_41615:299-697(-)
MDDMNIPERRIELIIPSKYSSTSNMSTTEETRNPEGVEQESTKRQIETIQIGVRKNRKDKYKDEEKQQFENKNDTMTKNSTKQTVKIEENEAFLFRGAQSRLCQQTSKRKNVVDLLLLLPLPVHQKIYSFCL